MSPLVPWLWAAGAVQLLISAANVFVPRILSYKDNLSKISPIVRQVFIIHSVYIVIVVVGFSGLCFIFAPELAGDDKLGRCLSGFMAVFWALRVVLQFAYVNAEIKRAHRAGHVAYTLAVACLAGVFGAAALGVVK